MRAHRLKGALLLITVIVTITALLQVNSTLGIARVSSVATIEHVILIGVDDVRPDVLLEANTTSIDTLAAEGSYTWNAWTVTPSATIAAFPSLFTGATPEVHGVTDWNGEIYAETIVEVFEEVGLPCALVGFSCILGGYSATNCTGYYYHPEADEHFMTLAIEMFEENKPYFMAIYNPMPDRRGHQYGHESLEYREAIENASYQIGRLVDRLKELGVYDSTLIVITTDHGITGKSHGHGYETDMRIFSIWRGPCVKQGYEMDENVYIPPSATYNEAYMAHRIIDIAPTITELVGLRPPKDSEGSTIYQIFRASISHSPTQTIYEVRLDVNTTIREGTKIKNMFYGYAGEFQAESTVWNATTTDHVKLSTQIEHPLGLPVEIASLVLTYENGTIISTITTFVMHRSHLMERVVKLDGDWLHAPLAERSAVFREITGIDMQWPYAPP